MAEISNTVQKAYDEQYDDKIIAWREINGKIKAHNIQQILKKNALLPSKICEVGCGEGSILKYLGQNKVGSELYGIEISSTAIEIANKKGIQGLKEIKAFDGYHIPYPDQSFDLVVCSHVIEHVEHPRILLREIRRISKHQYFEVPIDFSPKVDRQLKHFLDYGHINVFTPGLFRFLLGSERFEILDEAHHFIPDEVLRLMYKDKTSFYKKKIKNLIVRSVGLLRDLKPDAYGVLTQSLDGELKIF